ncbi:hypothetical protein P7C70_g4568, partial [Phenoliferia sp. Uapishka_3]
MSASHLEPEAMDTDASSSAASSQYGAPKPTLSTLPPELKALIVDMVNEVDQEDDDDDETDSEDEDEEEHDCSSHGPEGHHHPAPRRVKPAHDCSTHAPGDHGHSHSAKKAPHDCSTHAPGEHPMEEDEEEGERGVTSGMWALALLDREFSELAQKYIWDTVDLTETYLSDIGFFLIDIIPRRAQYITALNLEQQYEEYDAAISEDTSHPLHSRWAAMSVNDDEPEDERRLRFRRTLLAEMIPLLPNLDSVHVDMIDLDLNGAPDYLCRKEVTNELRKIGGQITASLTIDADALSDDPYVGEGYLADFIKCFPKIQRLEMDIALRSDGRDLLHQTIVGLKDLRQLCIGDANFVNEAFAALPWTAPIRMLALATCDELSLPSLITLVNKLEPTLEVLDLEEVPATITDREVVKYLKPLNLSKLTTLVLSTTHPASFLSLFSKVTLSSLSIKSCPGITYAEWEKFIGEHESTLKEVCADDGHEFSDAQIESLEVLCFAKGIELSVMQGGDDSEDDGEAWSGDEDPEEWEDEEGFEDDDSEEDEE